MADIYGVVIGGTGSTPQNGVTVTLWSSSVVPTLPAENTSPPGSGATATTTTGSSHGADGAFQFTGIAPGTYFLSWTLSGNTLWSEYQVPTSGSALATFNSAGGLTLGSASDLMSGAAGLYTGGTLHAAATTLTGAVTAPSLTLSGAGTALSVTNAMTASSATLTGAGTALSVTNNALISGTLTLAGATGLSVTNASTFNGQATFAGTGYGLVVNNNLQVLGTLSVATLTPTTFTVSGATTLNGAVSATAAGTSLAVTNNQTVGGSLAVNGSGTALTVAAAASIGNLTLTGAGNGLVVNNNALISGNLAITGSLTAGSYSPTTLATTGALSSGSTLAVTGLSTLSGGFTSTAASSATIASGTPLSVSTTADTTASTAALLVTENASHSTPATLVSAVQATAVNKGTGGSAAVAGVYAGLTPLSGAAATGTLTLAAGLWASSPTATGRSANNVTVTTVAGLHIDNQNPALAGVTLTNVRALDIAAQTGTGSYAIYSAGGAVYFKGGATGQVPLIVDALPGQTADILDININGARSAWFNNTGNLTVGASGTGLTVNFNALVSGNLTVSGTLSAGTFSPSTLATTGALSSGSTLQVATGAAINGTPNAATQQLYVKANATGVIPLVLDAPAGQTGNLQNWNVNGTPVATLGAGGILAVNGLTLSPTADIGSQGSIVHTSYTSASVANALEWGWRGQFYVAPPSGTGNFGALRGMNAQSYYAGHVTSNSSGTPAANSIGALSATVGVAGASPVGYVTNGYGLYVEPLWTGEMTGTPNVTFGELDGILVTDQTATVSGITLTATKAIYIQPQVATGANNYALYVGGGASYFKSQAVAQVPLQVDSVASQTGALQTWAANGVVKSSIGPSGEAHFSGLGLSTVLYSAGSSGSGSISVSKTSGVFFVTTNYFGGPTTLVVSPGLYDGQMIYVINTTGLASSVPLEFGVSGSGVQTNGNTVSFVNGGGVNLVWSATNGLWYIAGIH